MGRRVGNTEHGVYRVLVTRRSSETGEVLYQESEGPYATPGSAKGRVRWAKDRNERWTKDGTVTVTIEVQGMERPKWDTLSVETME